VSKIERIEKKIRNNDREDIIYVYPTKTEEEYAKKISALSNSNGGYIAIGVRDYGRELKCEGSYFNVKLKESKIREYLSDNVNMRISEIILDNEKIEYIEVEKTKDYVYSNNKKYIKKEEKIMELRETKIFLSYSHKEKDIADILEEKLYERAMYIDISRDTRDLKYRDNIEEFMQTISEHDFVLNIISDNYLKSRNCMYEVTELMRNRKFKDKLLFIIINKEDRIFYKNEITDFAAKIYNPIDIQDYIKYWEDKSIELEESIDSIIKQENKMFGIKELTIVDKIQREIQEFIEYLKQSKGFSFKEFYDTEFKDIIEVLDEFHNKNYTY